MANLASLLNQPTTVGNILKVVASIPDINKMHFQIKKCITLLFTTTTFLEGAVLTC